MSMNIKDCYLVLYVWQHKRGKLKDLTIRCVYFVATLDCTNKTSKTEYKQNTPRPNNHRPPAAFQLIRSPSDDLNLFKVPRNFEGSKIKS